MTFQNVTRSKMQTPIDDEMKAFLVFFYQLGNLKGNPIVAETINKAKARELKSMIITAVSTLYEMGWTDEAIDKQLKLLNLPTFAVFKALNTKSLTRILKLKKIKNSSDAVILRDAREGGVLAASELEKANILLAEWD
jgi:hypothetical protein